MKLLHVLEGEGREGEKSHLVSPSVRNSVYKPAKLVYKKTLQTRLKVACSAASGAASWMSLCILHGPGWAGHVQLGSVSAEALLSEEMCRLIPAIDLSFPSH